VNQLVEVLFQKHRDTAAFRSALENTHYGGAHDGHWQNHIWNLRFT
jgi:hypothetical protein